MSTISLNKLKLYYLMVVVSVVLSTLSFSYNAWRMEVSEANNNRRTAAFELFKTLAELEQNIYAAHYDDDTVAGSARIGWVKVGVIKELSLICGDTVSERALKLSALWSTRWASIPSDQDTVNQLVNHIEMTRMAIRHQLESLK